MWTFLFPPQGQIDGIQEELNTNYTLEYEMELDLQNKSELVDDIQNTFDTLMNAQKEYGETGYISVDTLQTLLQLEPKYLDALVDENGQLNLNKDALRKVGLARLADLELRDRETLLQHALNVAKEGTVDKMNEEIDASYHNAKSIDVVTDAYTDQIRKVLELRKQKSLAGEIKPDETGYLDQSFDIEGYITAIENQVDARSKSFEIVRKNFDNTFSSAGNTAKAEAEDAFQKAMDYWENRIGAEQSRFEQIQNEVDLLEKQGKIAGEEYYDEQIESEKRRLSLLQQQKAEAEKYLKQFKPGSDAWWEVANQLNDIEGELDDVTASIQDLSDAQAEVEWKVFDEFHERISNLHDELSTIRDLIAPNGEEDWFDDEGMWSDKGTAYLATYINDLKFYESELASVNDKLTKQYNLPYAGNEKDYKELGIDSEQDLYDARDKLIDQQYKYQKGISDTQQSVADMYESQIDAVEEWTNEAIEAYQDYIDVVSEALDAERD